MSLSNYLETAYLAWYNGTAMPAAPSGTYLGLATAAPTDAGALNEVLYDDSGDTGYDRVKINTDLATAPYWTAPADDGTGKMSIENSAVFDFPEVLTGQSYGTVSHWFVVDRQLVKTVWAASTALTLGAFRVPTTGQNGFVYEVTTAGTTAASEPTWPTTDGATVTSGTAVFTARTVNLLDFGTVNDAAGAATTVTYDAGDIPRVKAGAIKLKRD